MLSEIQFETARGDMPSKKETYIVTIFRDPKTGVAVVEDWRRDGLPHREDGPAMITRDKVTGVLTLEAWLKDGERHRQDGPAIISRDPASGRVRRSTWYRNDQKVPRPSRPGGNRGSLRSNWTPPGGPSSVE